MAILSSVSCNLLEVLQLSVLCSLLQVMLDSCQCLKLSDFSLAREVEVEEEEEKSTHHHKEDIMQATRAVFQQYCTKSGGRTEDCSVAPELASTSAVVGAPLSILCSSRDLLFRAVHTCFRLVVTWLSPI